MRIERPVPGFQMFRWKYPSVVNPAAWGSWASPLRAERCGTSCCFQCCVVCQINNEGGLCWLNIWTQNQPLSGLWLISLGPAPHTVADTLSDDLITPTSAKPTSKWTVWLPPFLRPAVASLPQHWKVTIVCVHSYSNRNHISKEFCWQNSDHSIVQSINAVPNWYEKEAQIVWGRTTTNCTSSYLWIWWQITVLWAWRASWLDWGCHWRSPRQIRRS